MTPAGAATVVVYLLLVSPLAGRAVRPVLGGATGRDLIPSLRDAGVYELVYGVAFATALVVVAR